jgi:hypothetical protein
MVPGRPLTFSVVRVPFFLEPGYPEAEEFEETNRTRLVHKWGGPRQWLAQKDRHDLKGRARDAGITEKTNLKSHRLVQWVSRTRGLDASERLYDALNELHFIGGRKLNARRRRVRARGRRRGTHHRLPRL